MLKHVTLKPSIKVSPPYVLNIRQVCYKPDSTISINLTYDDSQWEPLPYTITLRHRTPKQLYTAPLKIAFSKWTHLQEIKLTINKQYHSFYDNLTHHPKPNKKDFEKWRTPMIIQAYWMNQFISTLFIYCCKMFSNLLTFFIPHEHSVIPFYTYSLCLPYSTCIASK